MDFSKYKIRFETLGCRLNQIESEGAAHFFSEAGFTSDLTPVSAKSPVDEETVLCVINTCSVTQKAEQKARRLIRLLIKTYPKAAVLVTGCYAQLRPLEIKKMDERIAVLGGQIKSRISGVPEILKKFLSAQSESERTLTIESVLNLVSEIEKVIILKPAMNPGVPENSFVLATDSFLAHSRSSIKIQDGCNSKCAYCTINIARGKSVSLDAQTVIDRIKMLEDSGQSEVVITTVNIAQYHGAWDGPEAVGGVINFAALLKLILANTSKINIRISSIYPQIVKEDFLDAISDPRVCPHFHISVQSGSDRILEAMKRGYKAQDVIEVCEKIRSVKENPFLACDIITGFPGETDADFEESLSLCKKCGMSWVHAFPYSERPGTEAVKMKNKVPQAVSGERAYTLTTKASEAKIKYIKSFEGKILPCVVETVRNQKNVVNGKIVYHAVTNNFLHCQIEVDADKPLMKNGQIQNVRILSPLTENIRKGGETECLAELVQ
ncbi:MAG: tRNA (N(6)-L-threonylcarbamoyladenosine(37)-C(2))-methylthiotransferase MtaB [Treponema sp.]|nr:tRNA (N(6)-L-threonylcarbamoyladenosine(37)-C(2))-methylthiotransferase MtaB [Treponema sp.]